MRAGRILAAIVCVAGMDLGEGAVARAAPSADELDRARALDQQGVRAFREGRYNDAIRYFEEAYKLGAPSSELWNIARCYVKLDQPEAASEALDRYLARTDLSPDDRAGAKREQEELAHRRSTITVASSPTGALVAVDGKRVGRTPTSIDVPAGEHTIAVQREGYVPHLERVDARFGRAIIVDARLGTPGEGPGAGAGAASVRRWFTGSVELGALWGKLGSIGVPLHPAALVSLGVVAYDGPALTVALGPRLTVTYDSWSNTSGAPALTCGLGGDETVGALALFANGSVGYKPSPRFRVSGDVGFGFASELGSQLGGDAFEPSCSASPGLVPAGHVSADVSYALLPALRIVVSPIVLEFTGAFSGARSMPVDATGVWIRVGGGLGLAVDL